MFFVDTLSRIDDSKCRVKSMIGDHVKVSLYNFIVQVLADLLAIIFVFLLTSNEAKL